MVNKYSNSQAYYYQSNILNKKKQWQELMDKGDTAGAEKVAASAQSDYNWLKTNGYESLANQLSNQNYTQAAQSAKSGKVATRDYLETLGATFGLSKSQVDDMLHYDNDTGEVTIGGVNVGAPVEIDGISYMNQSALDNAWTKAMKNLGYTKSADITYGKQMENYFADIDDYKDTVNQYHDEYLERSDALSETALEGNPLDYDWAQAILGQYNYNGQNAANGELASGASSNGGNIDSFAAANAARQQLAYTNAGISAINENWISRLGIVQENLANLATEQDNKLSHLSGAASQRLAGAQTLFDNNETKRLNDSAIKLNDSEVAVNEAKVRASDAGISGLTPTELTYQYNPYLNADGTVMPQYMNEAYDNAGGFKAEIDKINEKLNDTTMTEAERNSLLRQRSNIAEARRIKLAQDGYGVFAAQDTNGYIMPYETADMTAMKYQTDSAERISDNTNTTNKEINSETLAAEKDINAANNQNAVEVANIEKDISAANNQNVLDQINAQTKAEKELMAEQAKYSTKTPEDADAEWQEFYNSFTEPEVQQFLVDVVKNIYDNPGNLGGDVLEAQLIQAIKDNMKSYGINKQNARRILNRFGADASWLD